MNDPITPYEGDRLLEQMTPEKMMECIFDETGLTVADGTQPIFQLNLGKSKLFFSRNLIQCFILDLHQQLAKRNDTIDAPKTNYINNGKLRLPTAAVDGWEYAVPGGADDVGDDISANGDTIDDIEAGGYVL